MNDQLEHYKGETLFEIIVIERLGRIEKSYEAQWEKINKNSYWIAWFKGVLAAAAVGIPAAVAYVLSSPS